MAKTAQFIEETNAQSDRSPKDSAKLKGREKSIKNLVAPWPKGVSGNPGGRPKDDLAAQIARAVFSENKEQIYKAMAEAILKGNAYSFEVVANRAYGKLKEKIEHSASEELVKRLMEGRKRTNGNG